MHARSSSHMRLLQFRLWRSAFYNADPVWSNTGLQPAANQHQQQTWKQLTAAAVHLEATGHIRGDVLVSPQQVCKRTLSLWNSGGHADTFLPLRSCSGINVKPFVNTEPSLAVCCPCMCSLASLFPFSPCGSLESLLH